jgi:site-specific DNA recombinase
MTLRNFAAGISRAHREKLRQGISPGMRALGYLWDRKKKIYIPDPNRAHFVTRFFEMVAYEGISVPEAREELMVAGFSGKNGQKISLNVFYTMIRNPTYHGVFPWLGQLYPGSHEPLVSLQTFEAAGRALTASRRKSKGYKFFLYRSIFRCAECGAMMTFEIQKGRFRYVRCTKKMGPCSQPYIREEVVRDKIEEYLKRLTFRLPWVRFLEEESKSNKVRELMRLNERKVKVMDSIRSLEVQFDALLDLLISKTIENEDYNRKRREIMDSLVKCKEELNVINGLLEDPLEPDTRALYWLNKALNLQKLPDDAENLTFLKIVGSNLKLDRGNLLLTLKRPWNVAVELNERVSAGEFSPFSEATNSLLCLFLQTARTENSDMSEVHPFREPTAEGGSLVHLDGIEHPLGRRQRDSNAWQEMRENR